MSEETKINVGQGTSLAELKEQVAAHSRDHGGESVRLFDFGNGSLKVTTGSDAASSEVSDQKAGLMTLLDKTDISDLAKQSVKEQLEERPDPLTWGDLAEVLDSAEKPSEG